MKDLKRLVAVARGNEAPDLVLKRGSVVNVFTSEIEVADVALCDGWIAGVGDYSGPNERDCEGLFVVPGFVDAHMHIESTMVLPAELVRAVLPWGTTTLIADPHEIVNVAGAAGLQFMLRHSKNLPCNLYYMLPSSVPSTAFETAGASFTTRDMESFLDEENVRGLGEVMCYPDVLAGTGHIVDKINLHAGCPVDGHAPGLAGRDLQAYAAVGIETEHEAASFAEAAEKARAGLAVLVREGSAAHNLAAIVNGLVETHMPTGRFMFCTDDKHLDDIARDGHIRWNVRLAAELGLDPVEAIRMGSWNAAQVYGLRNIGAVAAGYRADIVLLDSLKSFGVCGVYKDGIAVGQALSSLPDFVSAPEDEPILNSVHCREVSAGDFGLPVAEGTADIIELVPYQLVTSRLRGALPVQDGLFRPDSTYTKLCVVERHGKNGNIAVAPLKGYGIRGGAVATTVAHDSHNIIAAGDNDRDIALAVNALREMGGGYVVIKDTCVAGRLPLPVAGLMSDAPAPEVQRAAGELIRLAHSMGVPYHVDPFISLSFLALPVIPSLRLTDKGLFDVDAYRLL